MGITSPSSAESGLGDSFLQNHMAPQAGHATDAIPCAPRSRHPATGHVARRLVPRIGISTGANDLPRRRPTSSPTARCDTSLRAPASPCPPERLACPRLRPLLPATQRCDTRRFEHRGAGDAKQVEEGGDDATSCLRCGAHHGRQGAEHDAEHGARQSGASHETARDCVAWVPGHRTSIIVCVDDSAHGVAQRNRVPRHRGASHRVLFVASHEWIWGAMHFVFSFRVTRVAG